MKVLITRNLAKPFPPFKEGELATVTDKDLLDKLMKAGLAVAVDKQESHVVASPSVVGPEPKHEKTHK